MHHKISPNQSMSARLKNIARTTKIAFKNSRVFFCLGFATICQMITLYFPGKNPMKYYFYLGQMPSSLLNTKIKPNIYFNALLLLTLVTSFVVKLKIWLFKRGRKKTRIAIEQLIVPFRQQIAGNFVKLFRFVPTYKPFFIFLSANCLKYRQH